MKKQTKIPPGYKASPLGPIPNDWDLIEFVDVVDKNVKWSFTGGPFGSNLKAEDYTNTGVRIIQLQNIGDGEFFDDYKIYTSHKKADELLSCNIYPKEIIISKMGDPVARACFIPETEKRFLMASDGIRFVPDKMKYNSFFVLNLINDITFRKQAIQASTGSTRQRIGLDDLKGLSFPKPSLKEQTAIANLLNTWDKAIQTTSTLIEQKQKRKKWLMQMLLSGKKRLKGFEKTKWHLKSLEEVAKFRNGKAHENEIDENGIYKVVNSKFISTNGKNYKSSNSNICPLFKHEIALVMSDIPNGKALAKCFYVTEDKKYTLNQRICAITADKNTDSLFLFYLLNRNSHYLSFNDGVSQTNLKKEEVLECPLLLPEKNEQVAIAKALQESDKEIKLLQTKLDKLKEQKKGLMQILLTGKKRLKI